MNQILMNTVLWFCTIGQKVLSETEYHLVVVEEEAVPLASADIVSGNHLVPVILLVMGVFSILTISFIYWSKCRQCQMRIRALCRDAKSVHTGWNLRQLRETVSELEWTMAGK